MATRKKPTEIVLADELDEAPQTVEEVAEELGVVIDTAKINTASIVTGDIGMGTIQVPDDPYPELSKPEYFQFKEFVLQTLNTLEERIRDVEMVSTANFEVFDSVDTGPVEFGEGEEIPMYSGVQKAFNRPGDSPEDDGVEWFKPKYLQ
jgi:hypothetical protein